MSGGLCERKIVVVGDVYFGRFDEAARGKKLDQVVEATHAKRLSNCVRLEPSSCHVYGFTGGRSRIRSTLTNKEELIQSSNY